MTADLLARARAGDGQAFGTLTAPHRRELVVDAENLGDRPQIERRDFAEGERGDPVVWHGLHGN